jgi:hypothetical protein
MFSDKVRVQLISKSVQLEDVKGRPVPGMFHRINIWAVLDGSLREPLYETRGPLDRHRKEAEEWLKMQQREAVKCVACEE